MIDVDHHLKDGKDEVKGKTETKVFIPRSVGHGLTTRTKHSPLLATLPSCTLHVTTMRLYYAHVWHVNVFQNVATNTILTWFNKNIVKTPGLGCGLYTYSQNIAAARGSRVHSSFPCFSGTRTCRMNLFGISRLFFSSLIQCLGF